MFTLGEIADKIGGTVDGDRSLQITAVAPIGNASKGSISFVSNKKYEHFIETTGASALVVATNLTITRIPVIRHASPYLAFAHVIDLFHPDTTGLPEGIDNSSVVHSEAKVDSDCGVGPLCHVGRNSSIGKGTSLVSSVSIGDKVTIGNDCILYPGVRILDNCSIGDRVILHAGVVIGSDGFGFAPSESGLKKVKQIGWVEIEDDVEVGANTTIDRGALGPTRIGRGTKIDNLVQIAHNVEIGQHCIIVSQVGISGSTKIGNGVVLAGQVGIIGHIELGDGSVIGAQSGVAKSIPAGTTLFGSPAREIVLAKRIEASLPRLPELFRRVRKLEKQSEE